MEEVKIKSIPSVFAPKLAELLGVQEEETFLIAFSDVPKIEQSLIELAAKTEQVTQLQSQVSEALAKTELLNHQVAGAELERDTAIEKIEALNKQHDTDIAEIARLSAELANALDESKNIKPNSFQEKAATLGTGGKAKEIASQIPFKKHMQNG